MSLHPIRFIRKIAENKYFDVIIGMLMILCAVTEFEELFGLKHEASEGIESHHAILVLGSVILMKGLLSILTGAAIIGDTAKKSNSIRFLGFLVKLVSHWGFNLVVSVMLLVVGVLEFKEEFDELEGVFSVWHAGVFVMGFMLFIKSQSILLDSVAFMRKVSDNENLFGRITGRIVKTFNHPIAEMSIAIIIVGLGVIETFIQNENNSGHGHKSLIVYGMGKLIKLAEPAGTFVDLVDDAEKVL